MKKLITIILVLLFLAGCTSATNSNQSTSKENNTSMNSNQMSGEKKQETTEKLTIVTTIYPITYLTEQIVGDKATVTQLLPVGGDQHDWEPTAKEIELITKSNLFIFNGAGMEGFIDDVRETLGTSMPQHIEASQGIELILGHDHDHDHDDHHDHDHEYEVDPHTFNTPKNLITLSTNIYNKVVSLDPTNESVYKTNYENLLKVLNDLESKYQSVLSNASVKDLVVSHEAFGYLAHQYGLNQIGVEGLNPNSEQAPARVAEIIKHIQEGKVRTVFYEDAMTKPVMDMIAKEAKIESAPLYPLAGLTQEQINAKEDLITLLTHNLTVLENALK